ncbi:MAG: hypothetical protein LH618_16525, partial [Saprospiraceae bacterium]|nr:hypothetical protein [Saprospiraceae bacterium]
REVADAIWLFMHGGDYMGTEKSIVLLANYEAATGNFPLIWNQERNPFNGLSTNDGYFEDQPPNANIVDYYKNSNKAVVDYVVTWCMDQKKFGDNPRLQNIQQQLTGEYNLVFTSKHGLAKVYKRIVL